jgi:hypothetical protein
MTEKPLPLPPNTGGEENVGGSAPEDEINLLELLYVLVKYKTVIIIFSVLGFMGGYFAAKMKGPTYTASSLLVAKEAEGARSGGLSGAFGALGGFAGGLNMMGNPGLEKLELYLGSREFNAELIEKYDLLPDMFRFAPKRRTAKVYKKFYDTLNGKWLESEDFTLPTPVQMATFLTKAYFQNEVNIKKGTLTVSVKSSDSTFSYKVLSSCVEHLDHYIKTDVQNEAKNNVDYLEEQLFTIADPLLREKIQDMIASEIEKAMIVSREAFKVIDKPFCQMGHPNTKLYAVGGAFGMFLLLSAIVIFFHQMFGSGNTNPKSKRWVDMIREQLLKI